MPHLPPAPPHSTHNSPSSTAKFFHPHRPHSRMLFKSYQAAVSFYENEVFGEIELFYYQRTLFHRQNFDDHSNHECPLLLMDEFLILNWNLIPLKNLLVSMQSSFFLFVFISLLIDIFVQNRFRFILVIRILFNWIFIDLLNYFFLNLFGFLGCFCNVDLSSGLYQTLFSVWWCY